jgi:hypothetical protein
MTIGAHTWTHPVLSLCTDEEARREIQESSSRSNVLWGGKSGLSLILSETLPPWANENSAWRERLGSPARS